MMDFVATFQHWLTLACFVALAVCLFALAVLCAIPELTDAIRRFCGMDNFSKVVCGVCIVGAVLYGGSKGVNVRWDDGLADNGTLITNDTVSVRWTYSGIPSASSVFIDYREAGSTNKWLNLAETLASAQEWTGTLANATNYDYWVYSTYVPPVPVHTNGVWVGQAYETKARVGAKSFLILNGLVQEHGRTIAPPKWAEPPPYDAEVEYLESTSSRNAYFDTGIDALSDIRAVGKFRWLSGDVGNDRYIIAQTGSTRMYFGTYRGKWMFGFRGYSQPASPLPQENVDYEFDVRWYSARPELFINGESIIAYGSKTGISNNGKMQIFSRQNTPASYSAHARIYYCKIWQNGVLVRDYIAVRKGTVGYLYDKVSGQLFGSKGTGALIVGPDK